MAKAKKTEKKTKKSSAKTVTGRVLHDPVRDKLRPIFPLDLSKCATIDSLVRAMGIRHTRRGKSATARTFWKRWRAIRIALW